MEILEQYILELEKGWNLVSHPLTSEVNKTQLTIIDDGAEYTWDEATIQGRSERLATIAMKVWPGP